MMPDLWKAAIERIRRAVGVAHVEHVAGSLESRRTIDSGLTKSEFMDLFEKAWDRVLLQHVHEEDGNGDEEEVYYGTTPKLASPSGSMTMVAPRPSS